MSKTRSVRGNEDNFCCYRKITGGKIRVIWEITNRCNMACAHCFIERNADIRTLTTAECLSVVAQFSRAGVGKVMITGGEPFLRPDLFDILQAIKLQDAGIIVDITTNGTLLDESAIERLHECGIDELTTSLDGTREVHDAIRSAPGNFDVVCRSGKRLMARGIALDAVMVVNSQNHHVVGEVVDIAHGEGFSSLTLSGMVNKGGVSGPRRDLALTKQQTRSVQEAISRKREQYFGRFSVRTVALTEKLCGGFCPTEDIVSIRSDGTIAHCLLTADRDQRHASVLSQTLAAARASSARPRCII